MDKKKVTTNPLKEVVIKDIIEALRGTDLSITSVLPGYLKEKDLASSQIRQIYSTIDQCKGCGTWTNVQDIDYDQCPSCNEESLMDDDGNN